MRELKIKLPPGFEDGQVEEIKEESATLKLPKGFEDAVVEDISLKKKEQSGVEEKSPTGQDLSSGSDRSLDLNNAIELTKVARNTEPQLFEGKGLKTYYWALKEKGFSSEQADQIINEGILKQNDKVSFTSVKTKELFDTDPIYKNAKTRDVYFDTLKKQGYSDYDISTIRRNIGLPDDPKIQEISNSITEVLGNAWDRGIKQGETANILTAANGTPTDEAGINELANIQRELRSKQTSSPAYQQFTQAKGLSESLEALTSSPAAFGQIITELSLESTAALLKHGLSRVAVGAGLGAAAGSVIPGAGTVVGAGYGTLAGMGMSSLNLEYSGKFLEVFNEMGVDTTDPEQLKSAFQDEAKVAEARNLALRKGIPIAIFDMISGGVAGRIITKPAKSLIGKAGQGVAEFGIQAGMDMTGEATGQLVAGEDLSWSSIITEGASGVGPAFIEIGGGATFHSITKNPRKAITSAVGSLPSTTNKSEAMKEQLDFSVASGELTQEEAIRLAPVIEQVVLADQKIPASIEGEQREASLPLLVDKTNWENRLVELENTKANTDPSFHSVIDEEIDFVKNEISRLDGEIKNIINPKPQESATAPTENTDITTLNKNELINFIVEGTAKDLIESGKLDALTFFEEIEKNNLPMPKFFNEITEQGFAEEIGTRTEEEDQRLGQLINNAMERSGVMEVPLYNQDNKLNQNEEIQTEKGQERLLEESQSEQEPSTEAEPVSEAEEGGKKLQEDIGEGKEKRRFTKQVMNTPEVEIPKEFKDIITPDQIYYKKIPNAISIGWANKFLEQVGFDKAALAVVDFGNTIPDAARVVLAQALIKHYNKTGDFESALAVLGPITKRATQSGQYNQAFALWGTLSIENQIKIAKRVVDNQREDKVKATKKNRKAIVKDLKKANEEAATEAVQNSKKAINKVAGIDPKPDTDQKYGAQNKLVTKQRAAEIRKKLKGKLFSSPINPELIEYAVYHLEASGREFTKFSAHMIHSLGNKVKPYLKALHDAAKKKLVESGYKEDEFTSEENIIDHLGKKLSVDIKSEIKSLGTTIEDIAKSHFTNVEATKQSLSDKFIEQAGLDENEANDLAAAIEKEYNRLVENKKAAILNRRLRDVPERKRKELQAKIIELTNLGAFDDDTILESYAEALDFPKLNPENIEKIKELATKVEQAPEGLKKQRAVEDLLAYQANIKGISKSSVAQAIWYSNILSGYNTQLVNFVSTGASALLLFSNAVLTGQFKTSLGLAKAFVQGWGIGELEALETLATGYSPIKGKAEILPTLERKKFTGWAKPANLYKYVRRVMVAADVLFFEALEEMRAYQLAQQMAVNEGKLEPTLDIKNRALQILNKDDVSIQRIKDEALAEYNDEVATIQAQQLPSKEEKRLLSRSKRDYFRSIHQKMKQGRADDIRTEAAEFAARGTYNYRPEGALGLIANAINNGLSKAPALRYVIPFTNIIANVANEALNYTPVGFGRYKRGGTISGYQNRELTEQEKIDLMTKAVIGTSAMIAVLLMSGEGEDGEPPTIEITANGTGDYKKNYQLKETGWHPYSFRVRKPNGEYTAWYSYQYTPLAVGFSWVGNIRDYEKYRNGKLTDEGFITQVEFAFTQTMRTFLDMTFIATLNTLLTSLFNYQDENAIDNIEKTVVNTGKGFVIPNLYTQSFKDVQQIYDIPEKEVSGKILAPLIKDIPFARDRFEDKVNGFGDLIIPDTDKFRSKDIDDKLWKLVAEKRMFISRPSQKTVRVYDPAVEDETFLSDQEYHTFMVTRGNFIKEMVAENYDELSEMESEAARDWMSSTQRTATAVAKDVIYKERSGN